MAATGQYDPLRAARRRLGEELRRLRQDARLTQAALATVMNVGGSTVSDLERGIGTWAPEPNVVQLFVSSCLHAWNAESAVREERRRSLLDQYDNLVRLIEYDQENRKMHPGSKHTAQPVTDTLPRDVTKLVGRDQELHQLDRATKLSNPLPVYVIHGMPGVGKTTFAVHAAHMLAERFPDGVYFLALHGHTPGTPTVTAADGLTTLLFATGAKAAEIPSDVVARADMWRTRTAGRRILLLLDDATTSEQIRPLLPASPQALILVTSRRRLTGLDDAAGITLDLLAADQAAALFVTLTRRPELEPKDETVARLIDLCDRLPLAIRMVAGQLAHHPKWTTAALADDLTNSCNRPTVLRHEAMSVATAFDLSYRSLDPDVKRLFVLLGAHPGLDIDVYAAAALEAGDLASTRARLHTLEDNHLIDETSTGRYQMHDLIRQHARSLASGPNNGQIRAALDRLFDYYLSVTQSADRYLSRFGVSYAPSVERKPEYVQFINDRDRAFAWVSTELPNLTAVVEDSLHRCSPHAIALPAAMHGYLRTYGPWDRAIELHTTASDVARRVADRHGEAVALHHLGVILRESGDYLAATQSLERAVSLYHLEGDERGHAAALTDLGVVLRRCGNCAKAAGAHEQAIALYLAAGDRSGEAKALDNLAVARWANADYPGAAAAVQRSLELYADLDDKAGQASAENNLGGLLMTIGDYPGARRAFERSYGLYADLGDVRGRINARYGLGLVNLDLGRYTEAAAAFTHAMDLSDELGHKLGRACALYGLGRLQQLTGMLDEAAATLAESIKLSDEIGDRQGRASALNGLGLVWRQNGDPSRAERTHLEALRLFQEVGDRQGQAEALNRRAVAQTLLGQLDAARDGHHEALRIAREIASPMVEAESLEGIGEDCLRRGDIDEAILNLSTALAIYRRLGTPAAERVLHRLGESTP